MKAILTSIKNRACCAYIAFIAFIIILIKLIVFTLASPLEAGRSVGIELAGTMRDAIGDIWDNAIDTILPVIMSDDFVESNVGYCESLVDYMLTALTGVIKQ